MIYTTVYLFNIKKVKKLFKQNEIAKKKGKITFFEKLAVFPIFRFENFKQCF